MKKIFEKLEDFFEKLEDFGEKFGNVVFVFVGVVIIGFVGWCIYFHFQEKEDSRLLRELVDECVQSGNVVYKKPTELKLFDFEAIYFSHLRNTDSLQFVKLHSSKKPSVWIYCLPKQGIKDLEQKILKSRKDNE